MNGIWSSATIRSSKTVSTFGIAKTVFSSVDPRNLTMVTISGFIIGTSIKRIPRHQSIGRNVIGNLAERIQAQQREENSNEIFHHSGFG